MKVLIGAVAAAMLFCGSAAAQTDTPPATPTPAAPVQVPASRCGEFPAAPEAPDGERASVDAMQAALASHQAWDASYRAVLACRRTEAEELQATSQRRREEFNAGAQNLNTIVAAWSAEVEEFNGRQSRRRPQGR